ncbi:MAG: DEAD/DEAH box helicase [Pseudomonadota bacterium]
MTTFEELGLPASILDSIRKIGFTSPTPIQAKAIPFALQGRDVLGSAQTGTGKTAAFGIPLIVKLIKDPRSMGIIMTPTRELATQVLSTLQPLLAGHRDIRTALLIGGEAMPKQYQQLKRNPRIIVGTPGRINDHLERRSLSLANADFLVLDETDRMLDMGFGVQIDRILKFMPKTRQTLLFSATIPPEIERLAQKYQIRPERIAVGSTITPLASIRQELLHVSEVDKYPQFLSQLHERKGSILVFVKTKHGAKRMAEKLVKADFKADTIHGNLAQNKRDRVIQGFRDKRFRILVATDVASRGLDITHIEHVINYDLPQCAEDYIHRIGRTARAGATGASVAFITPSDGRLWHAIHKLMNPGDKTPAPRTNDRPQNRRGRGGGGEEPRGRRFEGPRSRSRKFDPPRRETGSGLRRHSA